MDAEKTSVLKRKRKFSKKDHDKRIHKHLVAKVSDKKDVLDSMKKIGDSMKATNNVDVTNRPAPITKKRLTMKVGLYNFGKMSDTITRVVSEEAKARAEEDLKKILHLARNNASHVVMANVEHHTTQSDSSSPTNCTRYNNCSPASKRSKAAAKAFDSGDTSRSRFSTPSVNILSSEGERTISSTKSQLPKTPPFPEVSGRLSLAIGRKVKSVFTGRSIIQETRKELDNLLKDRGENIRLYRERPEKKESPIENEQKVVSSEEKNYQECNPMDAIAFLKLVEEKELVVQKPPMIPRKDHQPTITDAFNNQGVRPPLRPQGVLHEYPYLNQKPPLPKGRHSLRPVSVPSARVVRYPSAGRTNSVEDNHNANLGWLDVTQDFATMQSHALHVLEQHRSSVLDHGDFYHLQSSGQVSSPLSRRVLMENSAGEPCCELLKDRNCFSEVEGCDDNEVQKRQDEEEWDENHPASGYDTPHDKVDVPLRRDNRWDSYNHSSKKAVDLLDYLDTAPNRQQKSSNSGPYFTFATPDSDGDPVWKPCSPMLALKNSPTPSPKFYRHKLY